MIRAILLDASPLSLVTQRRGKSARADECQRWVASFARTTRIYVPEIADYEVRRELIRSGKLTGVGRLDRVKATSYYLPLTTESILLAANLWAQARNAGVPTADPKELDVDVILAAQALALGLASDEFVIATSNPGHLWRFAPAELWEKIRP